MGPGRPRRRRRWRAWRRRRSTRWRWGIARWRCAPSGGARRVVVHRGVGGGGSRNVASRTPSMSRPSTSNVQRPSGGQVANNRPSMGNLPTPGNRPGAGAGNRPGGRQCCQSAEYGHSARRRQRCQSAERGYSAEHRHAARRRPGSVAGSRPAAGARPSTRDVQDFLDLPNAGGGNVGGGRHQAASVTPLRSPAVRWPAAQLRSS